MGIKYIEHVNGTATPDKIAVEYAVKDSAGNIIKDTYLKTWRPIKYGNTTLNDAATTLEFVAGSNISLSFSSGKLTIGNTYSYTHPTYDTASAAAVKIGRDATGHVVIGNALTAADVGAAASDHTHTELKNDLTLLKSGTSPGDSYALIFQRGTLTDSYNDWRIQDREGFLRFDQRGSGSSDWSQQVYFNTSGTVYASAFSGSGASLTSLNASNISSGTISVDRLPSITSAKVSDFTTAARGVISGTSPISYSSSTGAITHATALSAAVTSGLYKVAVNTYGHITSATAVEKADITALGIPGSDTNTTYSLSGALSSHKFTSTLTAGGSGSGTSTTDLTLAAGSNITLTDDTSNRKITISAAKPGVFVANTSTTFGEIYDAYLAGKVVMLYQYPSFPDVPSYAQPYTGNSGDGDYFTLSNGNEDFIYTDGYFDGLMLFTSPLTKQGNSSKVNGITTISINLYSMTATRSTTLDDYKTSEPNSVVVTRSPISTITLNGSAKYNPSFYAPTSVGSSGQLLKSSGSGAPTWATITASDVGAAPSSHSHYWANVSTAASSSTETSPTFADTTVLNYKFRQSGTTTVKAQMAYDNTEEAIKFTFV